MFDLDDGRDKRRRIIFGETQIDPQNGVVLAATDFEWTCRRAILALSKKPTVVLYELFTGDYRAFSGLQKAWQTEVGHLVKDAAALSDLFETGTTWDCVCNAMQCRNVVVHGTESRVGDKECRWAVCVLENACDILATYVKNHGKDIFKPISRRRTKAEIAAETKNGKKISAWHERVGEKIAEYPEGHWIRTGVIC